VESAGARRKRLLLEAYDIIGNRTPLPVDCGQLCQRACCNPQSAGNEDAAEEGVAISGMLLYPGEAELLESEGGFRFYKVRVGSEGKNRAWLCCCDGFCKRKTRPLACRVFPLIQHFQNGKAIALPDPRANSMCPLASGEFLSPRFWRSVERAFSYLAEDEEMRRFMELSAEEPDMLRALAPKARSRPQRQEYP